MADQMQFDPLIRREFILLAGMALAWPLAALGQQPERMRRIGVLMNLAITDQEGQARVSAFLRGLSDFGWAAGRNVDIETCWGAGDISRFRQCAKELVNLAPEVILAGSASTMDPLLQETRSVPIVFAQVPDPVGSGYVASLAHPGGNVTGFTQFDFSIAGKWLELLKTIEPNLTRVLVLRDLDSTGFGQFVQSSPRRGHLEYRSTRPESAT
jgi:putative ABC transport system substrate-binding protein